MWRVRVSLIRIRIPGFLVLLITLAACGAAPLPPDPVAGGQRLFRIWCSGCHAVTPGSPAALGPSLAGVATRAIANSDGLDPDVWLRREIIDPDVALTPGYDRGLMPGNYGQLLRPEELDALMAYMLTLE